MEEKKKPIRVGIIRERSQYWWGSFNHHLSQYSKEVLALYAPGKEATELSPEEIDRIYIREAHDAKKYLFQ
jgi:hypothetical protein